MMRSIYSLILIALLVSCGENTTPASETQPLSDNQERTGNSTVHWRAELALNDSISLPFILTLSAADSRFYATIQNGGEQISLEQETYGDSLVLNFPVYQSRIIAKVNGDKMTGFFQKTDSENYFVPFQAVKNDTARFKAYETPCCDIPSRWKATFTNGDRQTHTIGEFFQNGNRLTGSFITEFGDYRFLEGQLNGDEFTLFGFDGGYLQVFVATLLDENLTGRYYSGLTGYQTWTAVPDDNFQLTDPDVIAELNTEALPIAFSYPGINGSEVSYSPETHAGKVTLIQITGSWCPNCKDHGRYLQELKNTFSADGLEVIGVAFERMGTLEKSIAAAKKSKEDLGTDYPVGIAKYNRDQVAEEEFPFLKKIRSYPTLIILDKTGTVRKIHTGFSGPGTSRYEELTNGLTQFIQDLLDE